MSDILREFEELLSQTHDRGLAGSIDLLLLQMDDQKADVLRLCAIPHQFNVEIIRTLAPKLDEQSASEFFAEFQNLSIVISMDENAALHDEARTHLLDKWLKSPARQFVQANQRLVTYFEKQLSDTSGQSKENLIVLKMYHLIGADQLQGFQEFENIFDAMWHQYRMDECENLITLVQQYDTILNSQYRLYLTFNEGKLADERRMWQLAEQQLLIVITNGDTPNNLLLKATHRLGIVFAKQRNWDKAIDVLQQALDLAQSFEELSDFVDDVLLDIGGVYRDRGELNRADSILKEGLKLSIEQNDLTTMALIYNSLGTLNRKLGKHTEATKMFEESLEVLKTNQDRFRPAQVHNNLGMTYADLRDWQQSEKYFMKSLEIKRHAGDTRGQANTLTNLVRVYLNTNNDSKAIETLTQANSLFKLIKDKYDQAVAKKMLGKIYRNLKEIDLSKSAYKEAIELFEAANHQKDAEDAAIEYQSLSGKKGVPWWAWAAAIISFMIFLDSLQI